MIYIHMNKQHADYSSDIALCDTKHKAQWSACNLGVNSKKDDTEAIVKVDGADATWVANTLGGSVIATYDEANHDTVLGIVHAATWKPDDPIL